MYRSVHRHEALDDQLHWADEAEETYCEVNGDALMHAWQLLCPPNKADGLLVLALVHEQLSKNVDVCQICRIWIIPDLLLEHLSRLLRGPHAVVQPGQHLHNLRTESKPITIPHWHR